MILEIVAIKNRVSVKVALMPNFGPGAVNAESDNREQQIDDPDAEILARPAVELKRMGDRRWLGVVSMSLAYLNRET